MDRVFEAACHRRDEIAKELKELDDFIAMHRRTKELLGLNEASHVGTSQERTPPGNDLAAATPTENKRERITDNPKPAEVIEEVFRIVREAGRPMTRSELHRALADRGMEVRGANAAKTLGTTLWRARNRLVHIDGYGYWPIEDQYHPAGYYPRLSLADAVQRAIAPQV